MIKMGLDVWFRVFFLVFFFKVELFLEFTILARKRLIIS
jgi:hypothetical protein